AARLGRLRGGGDLDLPARRPARGCRIRMGHPGQQAAPALPVVSAAADLRRESQLGDGTRGRKPAARAGPPACEEPRGAVEHLRAAATDLSEPAPPEATRLARRLLDLFSAPLWVMVACWPRAGDQPQHSTPRLPSGCGPLLFLLPFLAVD